MEQIRGTLVVEQINGKRGPFCVGTLHTSIGEFKVTAKELDQFEPGRYNGLFLVDELKTRTVNWRKGLFTYIQATIGLGGFLIDTEDHGDAYAQQPAAQLEPDPLDDDAAPNDKPGNAHDKDAAQADATSDSPTPDATSHSDVANVFGVELYPLFADRMSPIVLDPTADRNLFRQQRDLLKAAGYTFVSTHQHWVIHTDVGSAQSS